MLHRTPGNLPPATYEVGAGNMSPSPRGGKRGARHDPGSASGGTYVAFALRR